ncbi:hypothetical protein FOA52_004823 [Chlamydomonas sp. UWO 241]|nr:hypothetical protein FOA52_004823 [Chlamydomonas sp. UWO 241]
MSFRFVVLALVVCCAASAQSTGGSSLNGIGARSQLVSKLVSKQWEFSLPESVLQRTFLFQGATGRLKQVLINLLTGRSVRIGLLGGSVSAERGITEGPGHGFFTLLSKWLPLAFPKAKLVLKNGAISGTPSMYVERVMSSRLDPGVDLVLLEYAVNNRFNTTTMEYEDVRSVERIVRLLLEGAPADAHTGGKVQTRKPAALLMVNMWRCCVFDSAKHSYRATRFTEKDLTDHHNVLSQYYGIPSVAVRNGLHHAFHRGDGIFSDVSEVYPPNDAHSMIHPNALGHKYMADMIVYALYTTLAQLEQLGITPGDWELIREPLPPPLVSDARKHEVVLSSWHSEELREAVSSADGWEWGFESGKGGFSTREPGAELRLKLDTTIPAAVRQGGSGHAGDGVRVHVQLGLLKSYQGMGVVHVTCSGGCTCKPTDFDTNDAGDRTSQTTLYALEVSPSPLCIVLLECSEKSTSDKNKHKIVLRGLAVTALLTMPESAAEDGMKLPEVHGEDPGRGWVGSGGPHAAAVVDRALGLGGSAQEDSRR